MNGDRTSIARRGWLRAAAAFTAAWAAGLDATQASANDLVLGQAAPPLALRALDGRTLRTTDLIGDVVLVTFWATWCDPCRQELPILSAFASQYAARGLRVLGFSLDGRGHLAQVRAMASHLSFPVGLLGSAWAGGYGRIWRIPVSFVIDRAGILRYDGWQARRPAWTQARLERVVVPLLAR